MLHRFSAQSMWTTERALVPRMATFSWCSMNHCHWAHWQAKHRTRKQWAVNWHCPSVCTESVPEWLIERLINQSMVESMKEKGALNGEAHPWWVTNECVCGRHTTQWGALMRRIVLDTQWLCVFANQWMTPNEVCLFALSEPKLNWKMHVRPFCRGQVVCAEVFLSR